MLSKYNEEVELFVINNYFRTVRKTDDMGSVFIMEMIKAENRGIKECSGIK